MSDSSQPEGIAIVGMAGRFPMAANVDEFWANLVAGRDCFREFSVDELVATGLPREIAARPNYVRRVPVLAGPATFDCHPFGYSPKEAELIDPQHRVFMECAWEALEHAGHDPHRFNGTIGLWAGCGFGNYFPRNLMSLPGHFEELSNFNTIVGNDKDYLATRIAYKFGLRGPAMVVQSACSTSLVALHQACTALLTYQCDMALAGSVSLQFPRAPGYLYHEGEIFSPDGFIRTFDQHANGTVLGDGAGVVVLRRLEDAIAGGDHILAVVRGSAVNNDGATRAGFTAPGVAGQSEVVAMAQAAAGVEAGDVSYIEAHGTGTALGDPIEVAALTKAFRLTTAERGFCGLGAVKPNIGHLDVAAGIAGLIKTVSALQHRQLPATLHFTAPNPELHLGESPFFVVDRLMDWQPRNGRRIAGVSSFGLGGTNAHVVVEEYTARPRVAGSSRRWYLLPLSAATETALQASARNLADALTKPGADLPVDAVQFTLTAGRQILRHRACVVAESAPAAAARLQKPDDRFTAQGKAGRAERPVVFAFSGQGAQYAGMARGLWQGQPVFREHLQRCAGLFGTLGEAGSMLDLIYGDATLAAEMNQTAVAQPALFAVEYALARLWESCGVTPAALVGHSIGEYVAACLAGVFSLEDAVTIVRARARLMQSMAPGAMLAVSLPEAEVRAMLPAALDLAVINGPAICVVSGPAAEIDAFAQTLTGRGLDSRRLQTSHGFHSRMMESAAQQLADVVAKVALQPPRLPLASNLTGTWMTPEQAVDPAYWARHLRNTVRFGDNLAAIAHRFETALVLEVGPGNAVCAIARQQPAPVAALPAVPSLRHALQKVDDEAFFHRALGSLWCLGTAVDLDRLLPAGEGRRVPLPSYPFEREELYLAAQPRVSAAAALPAAGRRRFGFLRRGSATGPAGGDAPAAERPPLTLEALLDLWKDVLGTKEIGPDDNFFDLGGHSLLAVTLTNQIEKTFGLKLPLAALLNAPTPRLNLQRLGDSGRPGGTPALVPIVQRGTRPPVFLFHSHGGNVLEYYRLATLLGDDRPVFAIQCHGVDGSPLTPAPLAELVRRYLIEIRSVQPHGPYFLGGYCLGGILAVEAALQLRAAGETTALVCMINSATRDHATQPRPEVTRLGRLAARVHDRLALEWSNLAGRTWREKVRQFESRAGRMRDLAGVKVARIAGRFRSAPTEPALTQQLEQLAENNDLAWLQYEPRAYDGHVVYFRARRQPWDLPPEPMLGWSGLLPAGTRVHVIPGFRQNLLDDPAVVKIAESINAELANLRPPPAPPGSPPTPGPG